jgi:hypothetical protein
MALCDPETVGIVFPDRTGASPRSIPNRNDDPARLVRPGRDCGTSIVIPSNSAAAEETNSFYSMGESPNFNRNSPELEPIVSNSKQRIGTSSNRKKSRVHSAACEAAVAPLSTRDLVVCGMMFARRNY